MLLFYSITLLHWKIMRGAYKKSQKLLFSRKCEKQSVKGIEHAYIINYGIRFLEAFIIVVHGKMGDLCCTCTDKALARRWQVRGKQKSMTHDVIRRLSTWQKICYYIRLVTDYFYLILWWYWDWDSFQISFIRIVRIL